MAPSVWLLFPIDVKCKQENRNNQKMCERKKISTNTILSHFECDFRVSYAVYTFRRVSFMFLRFIVKVKRFAL